MEEEGKLGIKTRSKHMTYREPGFSSSRGDGDGPKQVPTLLRAWAAALGWSPATRLLEWSNYITAPLSSFNLVAVSV